MDNSNMQVVIALRTQMNLCCINAFYYSVQFAAILFKKNKKMDPGKMKIPKVFKCVNVKDIQTL